jgi:hypothetical protein
VTTCGCFLNVVTPLAPLSPEEVEKMVAAMADHLRIPEEALPFADMARVAFNRLRDLRSGA